MPPQCFVGDALSATDNHHTLNHTSIGTFFAWALLDVKGCENVYLRCPISFWEILFASHEVTAVLTDTKGVASSALICPRNEGVRGVRLLYSCEF